MNKELEHQIEELRNVWRIGVEVGEPTPAKMQVYELVLLEMRFLAPFEVAKVVAIAAANWIESRDPYYIDHASEICYEFDVTPPNSLQIEISKVEKKRINDEIVTEKSKSIITKAATNSTLRVIANLIHSGDTLATACSKGATWRTQKYSSLRSVKASTLEVYYDKEWRTNKYRGITSEEVHFLRWDRNKSPEDKITWSRIREAIPEANQELKGERR